LTVPVAPGGAVGALGAASAVAEPAFLKVIWAWATLPSVMPASAPRSSKARAIPRCQRESSSIMVRVAFITVL
jgi:hypothetical protein